MKRIKLMLFGIKPQSTIVLTANTQFKTKHPSSNIGYKEWLNTLSVSQGAEEIRTITRGETKITTPNIKLDY
jgi:hypothetical protein